MAATHHPHPNKRLQQFILDGEAELDSLEEPARTIRAQSLFAELQHRFQPQNPITIADYTQPPSDTDVEDVVLQDQQDKLEEKEIDDDGSYAHGDEGAGDARFVSQLTIKCLDNEPQFPAVIHRGPDLSVIEPIAAKPDAVDLVSEGEIRNDERGYADYKPTRSYHDRVAKWMLNLQCEKTSKQELRCHFCGDIFEGRKGQKYCTDECRKHRTPRLVEEENEYGEFGCEEVLTLFLQLRLEYLMQKHGVEELTSGMTLDDAEKQRLKDLAVYMVKETGNEQQ